MDVPDFPLATRRATARLSLIGMIGLVCAGHCLAQTAAPARPAPESAAAAPSPTEPVVQRIVVEDDNARIDELHVRGEAQRITVQPKGVSKKFSYEIQPASGAHNMATGPTNPRGLVGQRLWSVLAF